VYNRRQFIEGMGAVGAANWASQSFAIAKRPPDLTKLSLALDQYFVPFERMRDFSGIIVVEKGTKQLIRSWGRADFASDRPHSLRTRYAAESISKMFTHAAVVALQSAGRLSMRDPLARFVPDFPRASDITIRQLVDHQAGISRDLSLVGADATRPHSTSEIVAMIARTQNGVPGK
jgi:CubicO group peptidase (beta-lactamase class C family)